MAIGFTPKHSEEFILDGLSQSHFIIIALETANYLKWEITHLSESGLLAFTKNGRFSWNGEVKIFVENGVANIHSSSTGGELIDLGRNKKNVAKFLTSFHEIRTKWSPQELEEKFQSIQQELVPAEEDMLKLPPPTRMARFIEFISIFKPVKGYFVTPILINLNLLIFIVMVANGVNFFEPDSESLLRWGANFRPMTLDGEWWRIITSCFLHIGVFHLLMNMYALLYIGVLLEPHLGRSRFLSAYILSGITASMASLWWHAYTISAGASGAIFGMYGLFLAMLTTDFIEKETRKPLLISIGLFVGYNLLFGLKGGIDNAAHISGLLGGGLIGYLFIPSLTNVEDRRLKFLSIGAIFVFIFIFSFFLFRRIPNDLLVYEEKMHEFASMEAMALEVYELPESAPKEKIIYGLNERGIYYWNENIKLLDGLKKLDLPPVFVSRNNLLREYCDLRKKSYDLIYKGVVEQTDQYDQQILDFNQQIEAKLNELKNLE